MNKKLPCGQSMPQKTGRIFRKYFDRHPGVWAGLERVVCPSVHFKCIIVDGKPAYSGSANTTGAAMGKSTKRRNFKNGIMTDYAGIVAPLMEQLDFVWRNAYCTGCDRQVFCIHGLFMNN